MFLPGTAPRCLRMDPELLGRTVRFHPCLSKRDKGMVITKENQDKSRTGL